MYLQHFIYFITYKWANNLKCLPQANLSNLVEWNTRAYWTQEKVVNTVTDHNMMSILKIDLKNFLRN
jgi:hypothetical protein